MKEKSVIQVSNSFWVGTFLALAGGYMDAYSYCCRGGVFANAETGNIVLLAINLAAFQWGKVTYYLFPIVSFSFGVILADIVKHRVTERSTVHWRQIILLVEILILVAAAFIPQSGNALVNSGISFVCGAQVSAFSKFHSYAMATTMCTGNLRSGNQSLCHYFHTRDKRFLFAALAYFASILIFIIGAMLGGCVCTVLHERSILIAAGLLLIPLVMMFQKKK